MAGMDTTLLALSGIGLKYNKVIPIFWQPYAESLPEISKAMLAVCSSTKDSLSIIFCNCIKYFSFCSVLKFLTGFKKKFSNLLTSYVNVGLSDHPREYIVIVGVTFNA